MSETADGGDNPRAEQRPREGAIVRVLEICNKKGLHARASAKFVQTVEQFDAEVWVTKGNETVGGTSIMGLMMLAAGTGSSITVEAVGPQAAEVMEALAELVKLPFCRKRLGRLVCHQFRGPSQICDEIAVLPLLVGVILNAQQERGMDGDEGRRAVRKLMRFATHARNRDHAFEYAACGGSAERDNGHGPDQRAFLFEPPPAPFNLVGVRTLVQAPLAALFELKMFHGIGDEGVFACNARLLQRLIENPARRSDKWLAGKVFLVAGLLPDQHQMRARPAFSRHHLGSEFVKWAAHAFGFGSGQGLQAAKGSRTSIIGNGHSGGTTPQSRERSIAIVQPCPST